MLEEPFVVVVVVVAAASAANGDGRVRDHRQCDERCCYCYCCSQYIDRGYCNVAIIGVLVVTVVVCTLGFGHSFHSRVMLLARWRAALAEPGRRERPALLLAEAAPDAEGEEANNKPPR